MKTERATSIRELVADDGYAITFQTMRQYRTALLRAIDAAPAPSASPAESFQARVQPWMMECFGAEIAADQQERNHRFLEEALELVQACGATVSEAHQLVNYVYGRPVGEKHQEVGGVMVTLAALCLAQGLDMHAAGETELARIWTKVEQIRAKQAAKPKDSPLPEHVLAASPAVQVDSARSVPAGYALVPLEPTPAIQQAAAMAIRFDTTVLNKIWTANAVYRAAIRAAMSATPPAAEGEK